MNVLKLAVVLLISSLFTGCTDSRRLDSLEKRVDALENQAAQRAATTKDAAEREQADRQARNMLWDMCRDGANKKFNRNLRLNGTKHKDGSYSVSVPTLQLMEQQKQNDLADCDRQYPGHRAD